MSDTDPYRSIPDRPAESLPEIVFRDEPEPELTVLRERTRLSAVKYYRRARRRQLIISITLFLLTFASTTLVASNFLPMRLIPAFWDIDTQAKFLNEMERIDRSPPDHVYTFPERYWQTVWQGFQYSIPVMTILLCHELGHFLQAVRYRVPASFPFFIPLPLPPLGTMGAVILQGRGVANRKQMFDIAVSGPLAGLVVTLPVLYYGIQQSAYQWMPPGQHLEFGEPMLVRWLIESIHGPKPPGQDLVMTGLAQAGWVGVFITALNLMPIGQLDGGHILYTLIGRRAHTVALGLMAFAAAAMLVTGSYSYVLFLVLLMLTGARHPPTRDDTMEIGRTRKIIGWLTLTFLFIGFTPVPLDVKDNRPQPFRRPAPAELEEVVQPHEDQSVLTGLRTVFVSPGRKEFNRDPEVLAACQPARCPDACPAKTAGERGEWPVTGQQLRTTARHGQSFSAHCGSTACPAAVRSSDCRCAWTPC